MCDSCGRRGRTRWIGPEEFPPGAPCEGLLLCPLCEILEVLGRAARRMAREDRERLTEVLHLLLERAYSRALDQDSWPGDAPAG